MSTVDRSKLPSVVLVLVAVLALSATAATIDSTVGGPSGQGGFSFDPSQNTDQGQDLGGGNNQGTGGGGELNTGGQSVDLTICIEALRQPVAIVGILGALALLFYGVYRRYNAATTILVSSAVLPMTTGVYFFLTNCATQFGGAGVGGSSFNPAAGGSPVQAPSISPMALGIALIAVIGLVAILLVSVTGSDEEFQPVEDEEREEPDAADFAEAAGRAADRIEKANVAVDNAVYRAWLEMTNLLDIPNPASSTPLDFAEAAIEFGLDEDDVTELTELFNEVRYGHMDPESREERAVEILRHIESEYENVDADAAVDDVESGGEE